MMTTMMMVMIMMTMTMMMMTMMMMMMMMMMNGDQSGQWRSISMTSQWPPIMTSQWVMTLLRIPIVKS